MEIARPVLMGVIIGVIIGMSGCGRREAAPDTEAISPQQEVPVSTPQQVSTGSEQPNPTATNTEQHESPKDQATQVPAETSHEGGAGRAWWLKGIGVKKGRGAYVLTIEVKTDKDGLFKKLDKTDWETPEGAPSVFIFTDFGKTGELMVMQFSGSFQRVLDAISFRIKGEDTWFRLADYYKEDENNPDHYTLIACPRCKSPLTGAHCAKCKLTWSQKP